MNTPKRRIFAGAIALTLVAAACGGDDATPEPADEATTTPAAEEATEEPAEEATEEGATEEEGAATETESGRLASRRSHPSRSIPKERLP